MDKEIINTTNDINKETAIQDEQQSESKVKPIREELHEMNEHLKSIAESLSVIMQYGIRTHKY